MLKPESVVKIETHKIHRDWDTNTPANLDQKTKSINIKTEPK